jgi:hypothetical protein
VLASELYENFWLQTSLVVATYPYPILEGAFIHNYSSGCGCDLGALSTTTIKNNNNLHNYSHSWKSGFDLNDPPSCGYSP